MITGTFRLKADYFPAQWQCYFPSKYLYCLLYGAKRHTLQRFPSAIEFACAKAAYTGLVDTIQWQFLYKQAVKNTMDAIRYLLKNSGID